MNAKVKAQWLNALRSGEYQQTQGSLERLEPLEPDGEYDGSDQWQNTGAPVGFCCLGVLCHLAYKAGIVDRDDSVPSLGATYTSTSGRADGSNAILPQSVVDWSGLPDVNPNADGDPINGLSLASLNDRGSTFAEIADVIEARF